MPIDSIEHVSVSEIANKELTLSTAQVEQPSFLQAIGQGIAAVNEDVAKADQLLEAKALGESVAPHELMIAMEQAKLSLQLTVEVRNRLLEGYQEIMRMQL